MVVGRKITGAVGRMGIAMLCAWGTGAAAQAPAQPAQPAAAPGPTWFTVAGSPGQEKVESVLVDLSDVPSDAQGGVMALRVNRSQERRSWDGVPYRSYEALVSFDCRAGRARYLEIAFYRAPLWQGDVTQRRDYRANPPAMEFRGMNPNPTERIVRAACRPVN